MVEIILRVRQATIHFDTYAEVDSGSSRSTVPKLFGGPTIKGFFCDDNTIRYPYVHDDTVSESALYVILILPAAFTIFLTRFWERNDTKKATVVGISVPQWVVRALIDSAVYTAGVTLTFIVTDTGKLTIGRLRPWFIEVCRPDVDCSTASGYIKNYTCLGDPGKVSEGRKSFPSGHSSLSFFVAVFLAMYIQSAKPWKSLEKVRTVLQISVLTYAWYVALTRAKDHWHHPEDIIVGSLIGIIVGVVTVYNMPRYTHVSEEMLPLKTEKSYPTDAF